MKNYDPKKAAAVWQRVQGQNSPDSNASDLLSMILQEQTDAVTYFHLSRQFQGADSAVLRKMAYEEQSHATALRGLYALQTGKRPALHPSPAPREDRKTLLRRCYGREMQSLSRYKALAADPQHGHIFSRLAAQEQEHCHRLLLLLDKI